MALKIMPLGDSITYGYKDNLSVFVDKGNGTQYSVRSESYQDQHYTGGVYPYPNFNDRDLGGGGTEQNVDPDLGGYRTVLNEIFGKQIQFVGDFYNGPNVNKAAETAGFLKYEIANYPVSPGTYAALGQVTQAIEDHRHQGYPGVQVSDKDYEKDGKVAPNMQDDPNNINDIYDEYTDAIKTNNPEAIFLMAGSNDVYRMAKSNITDAANIQNEAKKLGTVIDGIKGNSDAKIFLATIPPPTEYDDKDIRSVAGIWNQWIIDNAESRGAYLVNMTESVDITRNTITMSPDLGKDASGKRLPYDTKPDSSKPGTIGDFSGLHPNDEGYYRIALFWQNALIEQFAELDVGYKPAQTPSGDLALSTELETYLPSVKENQPLVGFFGKDVGDGAGDGNDEKVAFSFRFPAYTSIESAKLILDLTPKNEFIRTDELLFADNNSAVGNASELYGNDQLKDLAENKSTPVSFDLLHIGSNHGPKDLSELLKDGDLNVVYSDDAIISGAKLVVRGTTDPLGSPSNDTISGEWEPDSIYAGAGEDSISGGSFADWLNGESGNDTLFGNANDDTLYGGTGNDSAFGSEGADVIVGGDNNDTLDGQNGNDSINGDLGDERYDGNDLIRGGNGEDEVLAGGGRDTVYGGADDDWLNGQWGSDWVTGDGGKDVLIGEDGNDTLYGGAGDDYFLAGKGGDYVTGGAGNDTITFDDILQTSKLFGFDKIRGFDIPGPKAGDVIDLQFIDARPDIDGDQAFKLVPADQPQWGGVWVFDHSWDNSTMVQGWIGPTPYAPHGDWFQFWILDGPNVHARDYTAEDFVL